MNRLFNFDRAYEMFKEHSWDTMYIAVDLHGTIIYPKSVIKDVQFPFYQYSLDTLQALTKIKEYKLILFSASSKSHLDEFITLVEAHDVKFDFVNCNPECIKSRDTADFNQKFYFNVLLDDRAGFEGEKDWKPIYKWIKKTWAEQL